MSSTEKKSRGKAWTTAEDDIIRLLHKQKKSVRQIAALIEGRGKSSVHKRIKAMNLDGSIEPSIMDLGQVDG